MDFFTAVTALLVLCSLWICYRYVVSPYDHWKKRGVPSVPAVPILGSMLPLFWLERHEFQQQSYKRYGRIFGHYESSNPVLNVADPDLLRMIMSKDSHIFIDRRGIKTANHLVSKMLLELTGDDWKRVRSIFTPVFTAGKLKRMFGMMSDSAKVLVSNLSEVAKKKQVVDIKKYFGTLTMDIIASCVFAMKLDSFNDPENIFVTTAKRFSSPDIPWRFITLHVFPAVQKFFKIAEWQPEELNFFGNIVLKVVKERKRTGQREDDFLQLLIDIVEDTESPATEKNGNELDNKTRSLTKRKVLTMDELMANCGFFFLAGFDTTSSTLSYLAYSLALNPDIQEKLAAEVDETMTKHNGEISYNTLQDLKYMDMVISETLRMYPPLVSVSRLAAEDYKLGDTGITIPKGMVIVIPIYSIHYDPEFYPDPYKFDPERFSPEEKAKRNPYVYLPFGSGPRNCIGMRFALMEIKIALIHVLSKFRFKRCPQTKVPLQYLLAQQVLTAKDITLRVEEK